LKICLPRIDSDVIRMSADPLGILYGLAECRAYSHERNST